MRPIAVVFVLTAMALAGCGSGSSSGVQTAGTVTASPTQSSASPSNTQSSSPPVLPTNSDHLLKGNADPTFPAGEAGKVDVVDVGPLDKASGTLPVVIRNNTAHGVGHVDLTATARLPGGKVVGSGKSQGVVPAQIQPGGIGLAYIYFENAESIPRHGTTYTFTADTLPADTSSFNTAPIKITQANHVDGAIVGSGVNDTDKKLSGPYSVHVFCFVRNHVRRFKTGFANEDGDLGPKATISYTVSLDGDPCPKYLVGSSGYF